MLGRVNFDERVNTSMELTPRRGGTLLFERIVLGVVEDVLVVCPRLVSNGILAVPTIRTRLGDPGLALFQGRLNLQFIAKLHAIGLATGLQYNRLELAGDLVQSVDRGLENLRIDFSQRIKVWFFNICRKDDVRDRLDIRNLGFQR